MNRAEGSLLIMFDCLQRIQSVGVGTSMNFVTDFNSFNL